MVRALVICALSNPETSGRAATVGLAFVGVGFGAAGLLADADAIGVAAQTATKTIKALEESGQIRHEGEKRGLRLFPA